MALLKQALGSNLSLNDGRRQPKPSRKYIHHTSVSLCIAVPLQLIACSMWQLNVRVASRFHRQRSWFPLMPLRINMM